MKLGLDEIRGDSMKLASLTVVFVFTLTMTLTVAFAGQQPNDPPPAPVPTPIFAAKKVFISNATGEVVLPPGNPDLTYDEFYAAMKSWGRYQLVSSPAEADLVLEVRFTFVVGTTAVNQGVGGSSADYQFRLAIFDQKSHVLLWAFSETLPGSNNKVKGRQIFDQTIGTLVDDLKKLVARSASAQ
jgi:hypothetical protein